MALFEVISIFQSSDQRNRYETNILRGNYRSNDALLWKIYKFKSVYT